MKRSVYSLVLMDDVINAVDEQAYRLGTSRSNLINQILAERLSCVTPEMRMREIFDSMTELIGGAFRIQQQRSASLMTLRTALDYKYRPTINFKVELERAPVDCLGTLRVQIRTQSAALINLFDSFFSGWVSLEKECLTERGYNNYMYELGEGSFTRRLINSGLDVEEVGKAISGYLTELNQALQIYFSAPSEIAESIPEIEKNYRKMLEKYIL